MALSSESKKPLAVQAFAEERFDGKDAMKHCLMFSIVGGTVIALILAVLGDPAGGFVGRS